MAPGFAYEDYENGGSELLARYPEHAERIRGLLLGGGVG